MSIKKRIGLVFVAVLIGAISASPANNAEQIVFSDTGVLMPLTGNITGDVTPFGFWIWCAGSAAPGSSGGYQNANACQGSMYFYGLATPAMHVIGDVSEISEGIYKMNVEQGTAAELFSGTLDPSFTCTLTNTTADAMGPGNGVNVSCTFTSSLGGGTGLSNDTGAVVNVTGPK